jgi:hypothetical protein
LRPSSSRGSAFALLQRYGLLPTALFELCIAAFCINPLLGAAYVIAVGFLWLFWQIMRGLGVPFSLAVAFALALIALAGTAHAESWAMRCHNSVDGSDYDVSWHGDSGFVIIAAPGKSPSIFRVWRKRQRWLERDEGPRHGAFR